MPVPFAAIFLPLDLPRGEAKRFDHVAKAPSGRSRKTPAHQRRSARLAEAPGAGGGGRH
jgi:hypothetical protein